MKIPMSSPDISAADVDAVTATVRSGTLSLGLQLKDFEQLLAARFGLPHATAVNSGTSALHLAVIAAGIGDGDYGITSPFSFVASANCLLYERGVPVFVDVEPVTGNIDPQQVAEKALEISRRPHPERLKVIIPVHTFGQPADMEPILETAQRHGLAVIEDACEAIGAEYNGRPAGTFGDASVLAFYPNKQMTTGEGGVLLTPRLEWHDLFQSLRNQGRDVFDAWLNHSRLGYNYRLDEMSAALGVSQLKRLDDLLANRARVAGWYTSRLTRSSELVTPPVIVDTTTRMSWFVYVIRLSGNVDRDQVMEELLEQGVPSRPYFSPIHLQPFYRERYGFKPGDFPVAEDLGRRSLALPFSGLMTEEQVDYVCRQLTHAVNAAYQAA
jgi:dTDP-4-amino-4,6-dideoxygalactose transaminase